MSKEEELKKKAEAFWEACHGCNESDRDMWINFYIKGALANKIQLPTNDEIYELAKEQYPISMEKFGNEMIDGNIYFRSIFIQGVKWLIDKIKGGQGERNSI